MGGQSQRNVHTANTWPMALPPSDNHKRCGLGGTQYTLDQIMMSRWRREGYNDAGHFRFPLSCVIKPATGYDSRLQWNMAKPEAPLRVPVSRCAANATLVLRTSSYSVALSEVIQHKMAKRKEIGCG